MHPFSEKAFYLLVFRAILAALIAVVLMATRSSELGAAFLIGANVALLFSVGLIAWKSHHPDRGLARVDAGGAARGKGWPSLGAK